MAVNMNYLSLDSTLVLPVSQLDVGYYAAGVQSEMTRSQLTFVAYRDTVVNIHLPSEGERGCFYPKKAPIRTSLYRVVTCALPMSILHLDFIT